MKIKKIIILYIILILLAIIACKGKVSSFTLGVIGNFEGEDPQPAINALSSIRLAYSEFISNNPDSFRLSILAVNDSWQPEKTRLAYDSIIEKCDVVFFLTTSTAFLSVYHRTQKFLKKLHVVVGCSSTGISGIDDNVIRNSIDVDREQKLISEFFEKQNVKKVLVIVEKETNVMYTNEAYRNFKKYFKGRIIKTGFSPHSMNFNTVVKKIRKGKFDYIYILGGTKTRKAGILVQHINRINPSQYTLISPWLKGEGFTSAAGRYGKLVFMSSHHKKHSLAYNNYIAKVHKRYNTSTGEEPDAIFAYDSAMMLFQAVRACGSTDSDVLKKCIFTREYKGVNGPERFDQYGDVRGKLYFYLFRGKGNEAVR